MKRFAEKFTAAAFILAVIICSSGINACAIKIDGILTDSEWKNAPVFVLENQRNFENKINSAVVKTVTDKKKGLICLAVMIEFQKVGNLTDGSMKLSVNGTESALIKLGSGVVKDGYYPMESCSDIDELSGCTITEIAVHFKDGPSSCETVKFVFVDLNGEESGVYTVEVKEPETTTAKTTTEKTTKTTTTKTTTTKTPTTKITTEKTAKSETTKTTSEKSTTERTTAEKTTKEKTSEEKSFESEKTKKKTFAEKTKKSKSQAKKTTDDFTFKKVVKTKASKTAVKSKKSKQAAKSTAEISEEEQPVDKIITASDETKDVSANSENTDVFYPDEGKSKKYIFVAIGAVSAAVLAAAAVASAIKSEKKDNE